jgi:signal transduction histidine kinase/ligand-binding sensor domain-containing protein
LSCLALPVLASAENVFLQPDRTFFERAWQITDGLPENTVVSAVQDADGYLWVATQMGLYRFDGVRFREADAANRAGAYSGLIQCLYMDKRGRLWVSKDQGVLLCLDQGEITHVLTRTEGLSAYSIQSIAEDASQRLWFTDGRGDLYSVNNDSVVAHPEGNKAQTQAVNCLLAPDKEGVVWFSRPGRIGILQNGRLKNICTHGGTSVPLYAAREGGVWFFAEEQLRRVTADGSMTPAGRPFALTRGCTVTALLEDREGRLWIGTSSDGLYYWDAAGWHKVRTSHPSILSLSEDREGHLWVGTRGGGLNLIRPRRLDVMDLKSGLPFDMVQSVCEAADNTLWAVGQNGQLARCAQGTWTLLGEEHGWLGGAASCVAASGQAVYVGTLEKGLFAFTEGAFRAVVPTNAPPPRSIGAMMCDSSGSLWLAPVAGRQLFRIQDQALTKINLSTSVIGNIRKFAEGSDGTLWAATREGSLFSIRNDRATDMTALIPFGPYPIRCLHATPDHTLWLGFPSRGIGRIREGRFSQLSGREGLADPYVSQILSDDQNRLWLAGNRGIYYVTLPECEAFIRGDVESVRAVAFNQNENQPNLQAIKDVGSVRCRDGRLLFPLLTGVAVIDPRLVTPVTAAQVRQVIERLTVNGRRIAEHDAPLLYSKQPGSGMSNLRHRKTLTPLSPGVRTLEIDYTALCLSSSDYLEFRYCLEGLDPEWVEAGHRRTAYFGSLPAGDYCFRLQARTYDSAWGPEEAVLAFTVRPFLWQTWWFRSLLLLGVLALTTFLILTLERRRTRLRFERLEHEHAVERERLRISKDLHDELGAHLTGIALLSELAQGEGAPPEETRSDIRKIGEMARGLNRSLSEIVWAVNPHNDSIESFVNFISHFAEDILRPAGIRCLLDIPGTILTYQLSTEIRHTLFMVVKEALNNVVKHASATRLQIGVEMDKGTFRLSLEDNGCGFNVEQVPAAKEGRTLSGNGLRNMRHRVEQLGGHFSLQSEPGKGTRLVVTLHVR